MFTGKVQGPTLPAGMKTDRELSYDARPARSQLRIAPLNTAVEPTGELLCVKYSQDGHVIAASGDDGYIRVYETEAKIQLHKMSGDVLEKAPITAIRFKPFDSKPESRSILAAVSSDGVVRQFHAIQGKSLWHVREPGNSIYAIDYCHDSTKFATAGSDKHIRVYDDATKKVLLDMHEGGLKHQSAHANRIYSVKFLPEADNVVLSAGWDNTVQIWDLRSGNSIRSIYGPYVSGDAMDVSKEHYVVTGSYRPKDQLQIWDLRSTKLSVGIVWNKKHPPGNLEDAHLYAAMFSPRNPQVVIAAGAVTNDCRVFYAPTGDCLGFTPRLGACIYSVDVHPNGKNVALSGKDGRVYIVDL
eukprot:tig00020816_g14115.t1